ncbi:MAG: toll/interleukin-1 receptor domain-containing protein [Nitrospiraceae bacterium]|nr:MAG: toll/interleukin-1 receptor domain-containing protein [Nitrospiraceae bacterium]
MSDIFISYASEDRERIQPLVRALEQAGWSVFWDRTIPTGKTWREFIGAEIEGCRAMIVVWSKVSVKSDWVIDEAEESKRRRVLFPVRMDDIDPPFGFRGIQAADLIGWEGTIPFKAYDQLVNDLVTLLGRSSAGRTQEQRTSDEGAEKEIKQKEPVAREKGAQGIQKPAISEKLTSYKQNASGRPITIFDNATWRFITPSVMLIALGWALGWAITGAIGGASGWSIGLALGWALGGLTTGVVLRRVVPAIQTKQVILITVSWPIGWAIVWAILGEIAWAIGGAIGGLTTGVVLRRVVPAIQTKQVILITIGWAIGGAIGRPIGWAIMRVIGDTIGWVIITATGWAIAGLIGGTVMLSCMKYSRKLQRE